MANLENTLQGLEADDIITLTRDDMSQAIAAELSNNERTRGRENFDFYCFLIWPFIESTWLGAVSLMGLIPPLGSSADTWLDLKQVQGKAQLVGDVVIKLKQTLIAPSLERLCITRATSHTLRQ